MINIILPSRPPTYSRLNVQHRPVQTRGTSKRGEPVHYRTGPIAYTKALRPDRAITCRTPLVHRWFIVIPA